MFAHDFVHVSVNSAPTCVFELDTCALEEVTAAGLTFLRPFRPGIKDRL